MANGERKCPNEAKTKVGMVKSEGRNGGDSEGERNTGGGRTLSKKATAKEDSKIERQIRGNNQQMMKNGGYKSQSEGEKIATARGEATGRR